MHDEFLDLSVRYHECRQFTRVHSGRLCHEMPAGLQPPDDQHITHTGRAAYGCSIRPTVVGQRSGDRNGMACSNNPALEQALGKADIKLLERPHVSQRKGSYG